MLWTFFFSLILISSSLFLFWLGYQFFLARLTHFNWQRAYLLFAVSFSVCLPFIPFSNSWLPSILLTNAVPNVLLVNPWQLNLSPQATGEVAALPQLNSTIDYLNIVGKLLTTIYIAGIIVKILFLVEKLGGIRQFIINHPKERLDKNWLVYLPEKGSAFSFFNYIFLTASVHSMNKEEREQVITHEQIHSRQKHSLDIILVELVELLLWFHPAIYWIKNNLKDIHEYLVDEAMIRQNLNKKAYANLLLKLANPLTINSLTTGFNHKQIGRRISMLGKSPSASYHKLKFLVMIPIITSLLLFSACFSDINKIPNATEIPQALEIIEPKGAEDAYKIGTIRWEGNTIFTEKQLNAALQLQKGDTFDKALLDQRLHWDGKGTDVSSLYINNGYAYFKIEVVEVPNGEVVDLTFKLFEGVEVSIADVTISGNKTIATAELLKEIGIKKGDKFNRSKIIAAQRALLATGKFDPENLGVSTPILAENNQLINIEFSVVELE